MPSYRHHPKIRFQTKVLVPVIGIITLLVALTAWLMNRQVTDLIFTESKQRLLSADAVFKNSQSIRAQNLLERYLTIPKEPRYQAVFQKGDPQTIHALFHDLLAELKVDFLLFTPVNDDPPIAGSRLSPFSLEGYRSVCAPSIHQCLEGKPNVDTIFINGQLLEIVSTPIVVGGFPVGALTFGSEVSESIVREYRQLTHGEMILSVGGRVVATSLWGAGLAPDLKENLTQLLARPKTSNQVLIRQLKFDGEHFWGLQGTYPSLNPNQPISYVLLSSYESSLRSLHKAQSLLLALGSASILVSSVFLSMIVRKITQPLRHLRDSAEAVGREDFSRKLKVYSNDECGELALVFNEMTDNLARSRADLKQSMETLQTTQAQLVQSEKLSAIGEFVAGVTHELNNPLTAVIGFADLLKHTNPTSQQLNFVERILDGSTRCHKIVRHLLSFARQHEQERKSLHVQDLVEAVVHILAYQLRTNNIKVPMVFDENLPKIQGDPHQLQQVFLNLINNARQAIEEYRSDGTIRVLARVVGASVRLEFVDNGPGISEANLQKIFDPFFTTKRVGQGTGLGLSLTYGIVRDHGGTIQAHNNDLGGTTFIVELPISTDSTESGFSSSEGLTSAPPPVQPEPAPGRRVLVVDDEPDIVNLIAEVLTQSGYETKTTADGVTALRHLQDYNYDVILCDWKMPGMNGRELFEQLQRSHPDVALNVIFMTGDVINDATRAFLDQSRRPCLSKPFSLEDLRRLVCEVALGRQAKVENAGASEMKRAG